MSAPTIDPSQPTPPPLAQPGGLGRVLAEAMTAKVRAWDEARPRSRQATIGASTIGHPCDRHLGHIAAGTPRGRQHGDLWPAIVGTSVHEWVLTQAFENDPTWIVAAKSMQIMPGLKGTVDLVHLPTGSIIDHKTLGADALKKIRAQGPGVQYRVQVHMYGYGYAARGIDVRHVAIAAWPRSGYMTGKNGLHVWTEPYNPAIAQAAWLRWQRIAATVTFAPDDQARAQALATLHKADGPCEWCGYLITGNAPTSTALDGCGGMA